MATASEPLSEPIRTKVPAWGLSLVVHLALLLAIALIATPQTMPRGPRETDRPAAIVLVNPTADSRQQRYFSESEAAEGLELAAEPPSANNIATPSAHAGENSPAQTLQTLLPGTPTDPGVSSSVETGQPLSKFKTAGRKVPGSFAGEDDLVARERELLRPKGPSGPTAKVSIFGSEAAEGRTFMFVIDRSASTGSDGLGVLDAAAKQLDLAVAYLEPEHRFQIIAYNQKPHYLGPRNMTPATAENKKLVKKFFDTVAPYGATDHELALMAALRPEPDVIFLMTDGGDPFLTLGQLRRVIETAGRKTTIHTIQFGQGEPSAAAQDFMRKLAGATGGSYTYVDVLK